MLIFTNFIRIVFFIYFIPRSFSNSCRLKYDNSEWIDEWRIILTKDQNNEYQLLRDHSVAENQKIFMLCNSEPKLITATCKSDRKFNVQLPLKEKCSVASALQPVTVEIKSKYCPYTLYKIGFNVEINKVKQFVEVYQVCFDKEHLRPLFSINKAYPVGIERNKELTFFSDNFFHRNYFNAFNQYTIFQRFQKLLGSKQKYMSETNIDHIIDRGHLIPSCDFTLTNFKRSTFNMINVMPQFRTKDNGNWRLIEEWTRQPTRTPANVCTGVLDCKLERESDYECVLKLEVAKDPRKAMMTTHVPMFLADNNKIPITLWSYKIVKSKIISVVFLTLNNIYHKVAAEVPKEVCQEVKCPLRLENTVKNGWTFCCNYENFITKNVPYLKDIC